MRQTVCIAGYMMHSVPTDADIFESRRRPLGVVGGPALSAKTPA
jgi:hypothetical protein